MRLKLYRRSLRFSQVEICHETFVLEMRRTGQALATSGRRTLHQDGADDMEVRIDAASRNAL
jgi:hypothetical protein